MGVVIWYIVGIVVLFFLFVGVNISKGTRYFRVTLANDNILYVHRSGWDYWLAGNVFSSMHQFIDDETNNSIAFSKQYTMTVELLKDKRHPEPKKF